MQFKTTKTFWILIPVFVFFIFAGFLLNYSYHPASGKSEAVLNQVQAQNQAAQPEVLGAFTAAPQPEITQKNQALRPPTLSAKSALAFDPETGQILYSKNPDEKLPIASLTKIATALVAQADPAFSEPITITAKDQINISPVLHLRVGDKVLPKDLLFSMLVGSANDAALTLGNHFPDQQVFLQKMNALAAELGMDNTSYSDPKGFDLADNYSTANDLYKLVKHALLYLPYQDIWQHNNYSFVSQLGIPYSIRNSNSLVYSDPDVHSLKTGLSPKALQNMILEKTAGDHSVITIIIGSEDRNGDSEALADYALNNFVWPQ